MINSILKKYKKWISFNDFSNISSTVRLSEQIYELKEDLFQFSKNDITVDIGWYPDFNIRGNFILFVVFKENWETPILKYSSNNINKIEAVLKNILAIIVNENFQDIDDLKSILKRLIFNRKRLTKKSNSIFKKK